VIEPPLTKSLI